jgi:hypothetical protein
MSESRMSVSNLGSRTRDSTTTKCFHLILVSQNRLLVLELKGLAFIIGNGFIINVAYYFIIFMYFSQQNFLGNITQRG